MRKNLPVNKKRKILFVITQLELGGAQKAIMELARGLSHKGWSVEVVSFYDKGNYREFFEGKYKIKVTDLGMRKKGGSKILNVLNGLRILSKKIRVERYDIVQSFTHFSNIITPIVSWYSGNALRFTAQRAKVTDLPNWISTLDKLVANSFLTYKMSCVSLSVLESCVGDQKIKRKKLIAIPNGIDVKKYASEARSESSDELIITCIARLHEQKGHLYLLNAIPEVCKEIANKKVILNLVGEGELENMLKQHVKHLGLEKNVNFLGNRADIPAILAITDVLVLPSLWEGMPNVLLEAMAAGLPVVATSVDGSVEVVDNLITGLLVDKKSSEQLSKALIKLGLDNQLRKYMGEKGKIRVTSKFSLESYICAFEKLYLEALAK